ncbi:ArsR/SmtB family transcription factor [Streptomyces sp. NPDC055749]
MAEKPGGTEITELAALRVLAQPRRQQILQYLTLSGPATSAILARALGLNTGATSYHLRELARYGFVEDATPEEAEARAAGREDSGAGSQGPGSRRRRWWKAVPGDRRFPPRSRQTPETRLVMDELNRHAYAADLALFERLQRDSAVDQDDEWADAFPYSRGSIRLTLPELRAFFEEFIELMNRYKRPDDATPPGARTVHTRLLAFPAAEPHPAPPATATEPASPAGNRTETDAS